jgi:tRNA(adenine34) deaminase
MHAEIATLAKGVVSRRSLLEGAVGAAVLPIVSRAAFARSVETPATQEDERLMREAIAEAKLGDYPFGAVIVDDGRVLAKGRNLVKLERDPTAHGEMVAIRRFLGAYGPEKLKGTTLYTSGEPCCMCMGAIVWCGISRLVFAASVDQLSKIGQIMIGSTEVADKTPFAIINITSGVLAGEAMTLFN